MPVAPKGAPTGRRIDQRCFPVTVCHVDRQELDALARAPAPPRVLHDLARRIEPHRLRIEQRAGERRRLVTLEPAAGVHELGERGGVALRETVRAETLDMLEDLVDELRGVILLPHQRTDDLAGTLHVAPTAPP